MEEKNKIIRELIRIGQIVLGNTMYALAVVLFIVGTIFCYCIILNPAFQWLTDQAMGLGTVTPRMASYVDIIIKFELGFGVAFELPLVIFYLVVFNVVPYKKLRNSWRGECTLPSGCAL